ncbi:CLUMA_CG007938, isoform A [Clunio marinus]|uniref:CLUMA_CG007938, isoform A n=1 Tax=Clunio marinus TaxID=568069 RepID=A0A1J1I272_9DIPT|nr:CLUMA_CG007938, isoform A [Clunio marinus]
MIVIKSVGSTFASHLKFQARLYVMKTKENCISIHQHKEEKILEVFFLKETSFSSFGSLQGKKVSQEQ